MGRNPYAGSLKAHLVTKLNNLKQKRQFSQNQILYISVKGYKG